MNKLSNIFAKILLLWCFFVGTSFSTESNSTPRRENFIFYDEMRFQNKPQPISLDMAPIRVIYVRELWPNKVVKDTIDIKHLQLLFDKVNKESNKLYCIDIEHWPVDIRSEPESSVLSSIQKYNDVLTTFRAFSPKKEVGIYSTFPIRDYRTPTSKQNLIAWKNANAKLTSISENVDVIFPSLYTFEKKPQKWIQYAISNINQARQYNKKIIPFLWPQYHGSNRRLKNQYIDSEFWRLQLETVYQYADSVVIWTPATNAPEWDPTAPWWKATELFIREVSQAKTKSKPPSTAPLDF